LSDSEGDSIKLIEDAEIFLGNLIRDNAVAYLQDRNAREWTFTYYVNNARYRLEVTSQQTPEIVPPKMVERLSREPKEDWTYYHLALTQAVENLTKILDH